MTQSQADDPNISKLYKDTATEMPSAGIDQKILDHARHNVVSNPHSKTPKFSSRKWQWPISIAASVMLVSVIFINNQQVFIEPVESTVAEFNPASDVSIDASSLDSQKPSIKEPVELLDDQFLAESKLQRSRSNIDDSGVTVKKDISNSTEAKLIKEHHAMQQLAKRSEQKREAQPNFEFVRTEKSENESNMVDVSGSRTAAERVATADKIETMEVRALHGSELTMESFSTLDIDYLDALVLDLKTLENNKQTSQQVQQMTAYAEPKSTNKTYSITEETRLQQAIYDELLAFKKVNPDVKLPEKYLTVLAKNQLIELFNEVGRERPSSLEDKEDK